MADVLLVAATEIELCERPGLACGIGPVEAAAATARAIAADPPVAVLHVGIAGGRGITPGGLVIGSESLYIDLSAEITIVDHVQPDPELLAKVREAAPDAPILFTPNFAARSTAAGRSAPEHITVSFGR